jgi:hypothetical protein
MLVVGSAYLLDPCKNQQLGFICLSLISFRKVPNDPNLTIFHVSVK